VDGQVFGAPLFERVKFVTIYDAGANMIKFTRQKAYEARAALAQMEPSHSASLTKWKVNRSYS
jgi:hypothetical protein